MRDFFYAFIPNLCRQNKLYFTFWEEKIMMNAKKYQKQYYMPPVPCMDWAEKDSIDKHRYGAALTFVTETRHL